MHLSFCLNFVNDWIKLAGNTSTNNSGSIGCPIWPKKGQSVLISTLNRDKGYSCHVCFLLLFRILIFTPAGLLRAHKYCDHLVELETLAAQVGWSGPVTCLQPPLSSGRHISCWSSSCFELFERFGKEYHMRTGQGIEFSGLKLSYVDTLNIEQQ